MVVNVEKLVSGARVYLAKVDDNKKWCKTDEIIALIEAGATIRSINHEQTGGEGYYLHEVSYEGIIFTNATNEPARELKRYSKKK